MQNQRARRRHTVNVPAVLATTAIGTAAGERVRITSLSPGGAFVACARRPIDDRIWVTIQLPGSAVTAEATVRWSSEQGVGVRFESLRPREVWAVGRFLERCRAHEASSQRSTMCSTPNVSWLATISSTS